MIPEDDYKQIGRDAYKNGESQNRPGLGVKDKKQFDKGYNAAKKQEKLEKQKKAREQKKKAYLEEKKANADNESILRKMCDNEGIRELVQKKYTNMVSFITEVLKHETETEEGEEKQNENNIMNLFKFTMRKYIPLSKEYKNVVNHYANKVKKLNPIVRGAEPNTIFVRWMERMKEDSKNIIEMRNNLYMAPDIDDKLKKVKTDITQEEIDAIKKLIQKKIEADAFENLKKLARQKKKEKKAEARANRSGLTSRTSYVSSANTTPRIDEN